MKKKKKKNLKKKKRLNKNLNKFFLSFFFCECLMVWYSCFHPHLITKKNKNMEK